MPTARMPLDQTPSQVAGFIHFTKDKTLPSVPPATERFDASSLSYCLSNDRGHVLRRLPSQEPGIGENIVK